MPAIHMPFRWLGPPLRCRSAKQYLLGIEGIEGGPIRCRIWSTAREPRGAPVRETGHCLTNPKRAGVGRERPPPGISDPQDNFDIPPNDYQAVAR
jgi:hypothetical protein